MSSLVLASASRIRALLLERAGLAVVCDPAGLDEAEIKAAFRRDGSDAAGCAMALAEAKASRVAPRHPGALVIGADQLLVCGEAWLDKPSDLAEARRQLCSLRGRRHELVTAVALRRDDALLWRRIERPVLVMRDFSDAFLDAYLASAGPGALASAGAYQLEATGVQLFARVEGDYFTILGLPLLPLLDCLRGLGALAA
ncbi:MAG TPA: Maf family protein [Stellaceae bacterium]|nr:Maf family protein [Stellaceae bacterium]